MRWFDPFPDEHRYRVLIPLDGPHHAPPKPLLAPLWGLLRVIARLFGAQLVLLVALLAGCDGARERWDGTTWLRKTDGTCALVIWSGGSVDRVVEGLACPKETP